MKIFLIILGVVLLLLLCPVRLTLRWQQELTVTLRWLFLRFTLLPAPQKKKKAEKPAAGPSAEGAKTAKTPSGSKPGDLLAQYADQLPALLRRLGRSAAFILRHVRVDQLRLRLVVARGDAAETAVAYGRANQAVYTALGLLQGLLKVRCDPDIGIAFDFLGEEETIDAAGRISLAPLFALGGALSFLAGALVLFFRRSHKASES